MEVKGVLVAKFDYTYDHNQRTISIKKGDKFSLMNKANEDWWHVRRKLSAGNLEELYVPAKYVQEVKAPQTLQNLTSKQSSLPRSVNLGQMKDSDLYENVKDVFRSPPVAKKPVVKTRNGPGLGKPRPRSFASPERSREEINQTSTEVPSLNGDTISPTSLANEGLYDRLSSFDLTVGMSDKPSSAKTSPNASSVVGPEPTEGVLPQGWKEYHTEDGKTFYYNEKTQISSWMRPKVQTTPRSKKGTVPKGWLKEVNPFGQPIYINIKTKEKWAMAQTTSGETNFYSVGNPTITLNELPEVNVDNKDATSPNETHTLDGSTEVVSQRLLSTQLSNEPIAEEIETSTNDQQIETPTQQMETPAQQMEAPAQQMETPTQQMETSTQQMETSTQQVETSTQQVETSTQQMETSTQKIETFSQQIEASLLQSTPSQAKPSAADVANASLDRKQSTDPIIIEGGTFEQLTNEVTTKHGYLNRKKLFDPNGKKSATRQWAQVYVMMQNHKLYFYRDHKTAREAGVKPINIFNMVHATVRVATAYQRRKFVIEVTAQFGEQFYLQADTQKMMDDWYISLYRGIEKANEEYKKNPSAFQLPASQLSPGSSPQPKKVHKRKESTASAMDSDDDEPEDAIESNSKNIRNRLNKLVSRRSTMEQLKMKGIYKDQVLVFGCTLEKLCQKEKVSIPKFVSLCMQEVEKRGLNSVGIYRLSGNTAEITKLRYLVDQDEPYTLSDVQWDDINVITGALKLFFRELPNPLIPNNLFDKFIEAGRIPDTPKRNATLAKCIKELPKVNHAILVALLTHLRRVIERSEENKMQAQNVAIVFGPTLMRTDDPLLIATLAPVQNNIVQNLLTDFNKIF